MTVHSELAKRSFERVQTSHEAPFAFEELPLLTQGTSVAGWLDGTATIAYHIDDDGSFEWFVHDIYLDAMDRSTRKRTSIQVERGTGLYVTIWSELTDGSFKNAVQNRVAKWVVEDLHS